MAYEQRDMSGALFGNDKGGNDARPDYRGDVVINGKKWALAGWIKLSKTGKKFMSLSVSEPKTDQPAQPKPQADPMAAKVQHEFDGEQIDPSDIPF